MMFCGELPISTGVTSHVIQRTKTVSAVLLGTTIVDLSGFILALRKSRLGYEWRLYPVPLLFRLLRMETRHEHIMRRKLEGFRFYVIEIREDGMGQLYPYLMVPYLSFIKGLQQEMLSLSMLSK